MVATVIEWSVRNRSLVALLGVAVAALGVWSARVLRLDAIPDLSDVQVIVVTEYPGQNPTVVDDQVTYPLATAMLSVPGSTDVRGISMFGLSFVYVLFEDGTDLYWARSRVLEYLNYARDRLPRGVEPKLGPDATGVGWVLQYVLFPGWYCKEHPRGIWRDALEDRWYAKLEDAPPGRRSHLERVRGFEEPGVCPVDGSPLIGADQDLADLRSLQDWFLRYPLAAVEGVAEVASLGGFVRQVQVTVDPHVLHAYGVSVDDIVRTVERSNNDVGGAVVERAEHEYMVRSRGYVRLGELADLENSAVGTAPNGAPILLRQVARVETTGEMRRGVGEYNGRGEVVGGIVVARFGENAYKVIRDVKRRLAELEEGLPPGVFPIITYDRSALIERAVDTLREALLEELAVVVVVCALFLLHVRSALVVVLVLPLGLLASLAVMQMLGMNANIMSLGGLALAIGVMVDSAIVMVDNAHRHLSLETARVAGGGEPRGRVDIVLEAAKEVGPSLFFSLLIITLSFLPIFTLGEQSGRLFKPLAYTKTFAMAAGALLGITLVPVLMVWLIRGRILPEERNPLNRWLIRLYEPTFWAALRWPWLTVALVILIGLSTLYPLSQLGEEFMPALDEGDLLYMPTTEPSISVTKSRELLQQSDKLLRLFPEVRTVHGKIGRAETATDPAPLSMIETVVQLHTDPAQWRTRPVRYFFSDWPAWLKWPLTATFWPEQRRITTEELKLGWTDPDGTRHPGLNEVVHFPGVANAWPYPIENRINMLTTGIKTPVGVKILGADLAVLNELAERTAVVLQERVAGTLSAYPERTVGGYYLDLEVRREEAARYGLTVADVQDVIQTAIGGREVSTIVSGLERYPIVVRYARELRDDPELLRQILVRTPSGQAIPLGQLVDISVRPGPSMIRSENGQRTAWVYVDMAGRDLGGYVREAKRIVADEVPLPQGYNRVWSGRFEYLQKANERLMLVVPLTLLVVVVLLYIANGSWFRVAVVLLAVPLSLVGAFWLLWLLGYNLSLAVWVGIIALLGLDAETGQVMLLYLENSYKAQMAAGKLQTRADLLQAIHAGAVQRIRPKFMTVATDLLALLPLLWVTGTGAEVTRRLVAPLVGGIGVSFVMELLVYPVVFYLVRRRGLAPA
ncbi:MAG: CusA/CzcA family heavy metal efflux RND transporter [Candidatus Binatia bacterium]|nr:CusA/CzcA family heavy metal efflux RND transporter [Candidatus Binatia bacterium]